jgi:hypothetical protein
VEPTQDTAQGRPGDTSDRPAGDVDAPVVSSSSGARAARARPSRRDAVTLLVVAGFVLYLLVSLMRLAADDHPMSFIDEHTHLDTQFKVHNGTFPHRGSLYGPLVIDEWACGVSHQAGPTLVPCGDPALGPDDLVSGKYTTGYIHYPTYFVGGEAFRVVSDAVTGDRRPIDVYRQFAALMFTLGVVASAVISWRLGLRGSALVAATFVPSAASGILMFGTMVNPMSTALLAGALIGGATLRWMLTGRGFWLVALATAFAASIAVTDSLPAGSVVLAILFALVLRARGIGLDTPWRPRWWHAAVLAVVLVAPIVGFGQVIAGRATVPDTALYGGFGFQSWTPVLVGSLRELAVLHNPWQEGSILEIADNDTSSLLVRSVGYGIPEWVTVLVLGCVALVALGLGRQALTVRRPVAGADASTSPADEVRPDTSGGVADGAARPRQVRTIGVLATALLAGIVLYPPALRLSNALTAGVDNGIVARYSIAFAPLLLWVALLATRPLRGYSRLLAGLGLLSVVALCVSAW